MDSTKPTVPFWRAKMLTEMTSEEFESLCDQCGKCCAIVVEFADIQRSFRTDVACRYLSLTNCGCSVYANRLEVAPWCSKVDPAFDMNIYPKTCAYRLVQNGEDLPEWHPLISGTGESVIREGASAVGVLISESEIPEAELVHRLVEAVE